MNASLRHVGIVVQDIESWINFLVTEFEFVIWRDQIENGDFVTQLLGLSETKVRTVKLKDSIDGVIELLYFYSPISDQTSFRYLTPNSYGITHIAIQVESIALKLESLSRIGYIPIFPAQLSADGKAKVCYLRGPENVLFELVELIA